MKILILSCNTGEGHNSSAYSLKAAMKSQGIDCEVQDTIALMSPVASKNVSDAYVYSTKSSLFEHAYKLGEAVSNMDTYFKSPVYAANKIYTKQLYDLIIDGGYDAVVCVHLFPAEALTALKRKAKIAVPTVFVMTDYTCIPFLTETELDKYVIAHEDLVEEFAERGIPREKIVPLGIPVDATKFCSRQDKQYARCMLEEEFGWKSSNASARWFMIMGGSMGFGNMDGLVSCLLELIRPDDKVLCICGRNENQLAALAEEYAGYANLHAIGYTDKVSLMMDASDVLFSKPGGITGTEAVLKQIPLVHTAPIPGLEDKNARFFHYHNMSYSSLDPAQQAAVALRLCDDAAYRLRMTEAQRRNSYPNCCNDIIALLLDIVGKECKPSAE